jgi:very-short-patch-repair endonuclease
MAAREADERRTRELSRLGYRVLRFWDNEMLANTQGVLDSIYEALNSSPQSSPQRGEEEAGGSSSPLNGRG